MPLTFPAHQALVLPLKDRWPDRFDGLALVVSSGAPDLGYAIGGLPFASHSVIGVVAFALPVTVVYTWVLRRWGTPGLARLIPADSVWSRYRSVGRRPPSWWITLGSVLVGAGSHVLVDSFTHSGRWGSRTLGLDRHLFTAPNGAFTIARIIQYVGHSVGSLIGVYLLWRLAETRPPPPPMDGPPARAMAAVLATVAVAAAVTVGWMSQSGVSVFVVGASAVMTLLAASVVLEATTRPLP